MNFGKSVRESVGLCVTTLEEITAGCNRKALCVLADQSTTQRAITTTHQREVGTDIVSASRRLNKEENKNGCQTRTIEHY